MQTQETLNTYIPGELNPPNCVLVPLEEGPAKHAGEDQTVLLG